MKDIAAGDSKERLLTESLGLNEEEERERQAEMDDDQRLPKITPEDTDQDEEKDGQGEGAPTGQSVDSKDSQQVPTTKNEFYMHGKLSKKLSSKVGNYDIQNEV